VHHFPSLFGDGHTGAQLDLRDDLPVGYLPFAVGEIGGGKLVAVDTEAGGFMDLDHPVVTKLDGLPLDQSPGAGRLARRPMSFPEGGSFR